MDSNFMTDEYYAELSKNVVTKRDGGITGYAERFATTPTLFLTEKVRTKAKHYAGVKSAVFSKYDVRISDAFEEIRRENSKLLAETIYCFFREIEEISSIGEQKRVRLFFNIKNFVDDTNFVIKIQRCLDLFKLAIEIKKTRCLTDALNPELEPLCVLFNRTHHDTKYELIKLKYKISQPEDIVILLKTARSSLRSWKRPLQQNDCLDFLKIIRRYVAKFRAAIRRNLEPCFSPEKIKAMKESIRRFDHRSNVMAVRIQAHNIERCVDGQINMTRMVEFQFIAERDVAEAERRRRWRVARERRRVAREGRTTLATMRMRLERQERVRAYNIQIIKAAAVCRGGQAA